MKAKAADEARDAAYAEARCARDGKFDAAWEAFNATYSKIDDEYCETLDRADRAYERAVKKRKR